MKLALVTESVNDYTGIGRIVSILADKFALTGHEVHVFSFSIDTSSANWFPHLIRPRTSFNSINRWNARYLVPTITRRHKFDIINTFTYGRGANVVSAQSCHAVGVDLPQGLNASVRPKHNFGIVDRLTIADENILFNIPKTKSIIAVSQLVKNQICANYGTDSAKVRVIPNGVDAGVFSADKHSAQRKSIRDQLRITSDEFVLLFVGNEFARKGLHVVLKSMGRLTHQNIRLLVVGNDNRKPFEELARGIGVSERVTFLGAQTNVEMYFHAADAFIFPTFYEPFGIVIIEAMAAGIPVITALDAGAVESAKDGEHALLLEAPHSPDELTAKLQVLLGNADLRSRLVDRARDFSRRFSWVSIAQKTLDVYNESV